MIDALIIIIILLLLGILIKISIILFLDENMKNIGILFGLHIHIKRSPYALAFTICSQIGPWHLRGSFRRVESIGVGNT